jgi:hypothetical protein
MKGETEMAFQPGAMERRAKSRSRRTLFDKLVGYGKTKSPITTGHKGGLSLQIRRVVDTVDIQVPLVSLFLRSGEPCRLVRN